MNPRIAVVIPALNEEATIGEVLREFHAELPDAAFWIVDNNSTDRTRRIAQDALETLGCAGGVLLEPRRGKSHAVRKAFAQLEYDIYVMVDADLTYSAKDIHTLIQPIAAGEADISIGDRFAAGQYDHVNTRRFHGIGNRMVVRLINFLFRSNLNDIMSGFRAMTREFAKLYPIQSAGFELETDMCIHALDKRFMIVERPIAYNRRPTGSQSKLSTFSDGIRIILRVFTLFKSYKPMLFFGSLAILSMTVGILVGIPVIVEFAETGLVYRIPSAILATGLCLYALLLFNLGVTLDTLVTFSRADYELRRMLFASTLRSSSGSPAFTEGGPSRPVHPPDQDGGA